MNSPAELQKPTLDDVDANGVAAEYGVDEDPGAADQKLALVDDVAAGSLKKLAGGVDELEAEDADAKEAGALGVASA